ncbi:MAG: flavin reductase family protein [Corynebacterium sp.]|nr:flavin reductase family protein [Corynebacterium sp.]
MSPIDSTHYRQTVGNFPSGVTVVTTRDTEEAQDIGLTVSAFVSLSLEPAMVLLSIDAKSKSHQYLHEGAPIGVSILAKDQLHLAVQFARHGIDRFADVDIIRRGDNDIPFINHAAAWFLGTVTNCYVGGDHIILTVTVNDCNWEEENRPLIYQRGKLHGWPEELG